MVTSAQIEIMNISGVKYSALHCTDTSAHAHITCNAGSPPQTLSGDPVQCCGSFSNPPTCVPRHDVLWKTTKWSYGNASVTASTRVTFNHSRVMMKIRLFELLSLFVTFQNKSHVGVIHTENKSNTVQSKEIQLSSMVSGSYWRSCKTCMFPMSFRRASRLATTSFSSSTRFLRVRLSSNHRSWTWEM